MFDLSSFQMKTFPLMMDGKPAGEHTDKTARWGGHNSKGK